MQARNVSGSFQLLDGIRWSEVSVMLIDSLIEPAFMKWIEEEQALENGKIDELYHQFELLNIYYVAISASCRTVDVKCISSLGTLLSMHVVLFQ